MSLKLIYGNAVQALKDGEIQVLAHGVNCSGGFASGIAGEIAKEFPEARRQYLQAFAAGKWALGEMQTVFVSEKPEKVIFNCATQMYYGREKGKIYADLGSVESILRRTAFIMTHSPKVVGFPLIGAGLGGLEPVEVYLAMKEIFEKEYPTVDANLYVLDKTLFAILKQKGAACERGN